MTGFQLLASTEVDLGSFLGEDVQPQPGGHVAEEARTEEDAGQQLADHRWQADVDGHLAQGPGDDEQQHELDQEQQRLVLAQRCDDGKGTPLRCEWGEDETAERQTPPG